MAFDFKKEYKEFYMPGKKPEIVNVPRANYIAVRGKGDPNEEGGAYQQAVLILYAIAYTLKMSYKTDHKIEGFIEYIVPPLEGFWWQEGKEKIDYTRKEDFHWISLIRLPELVTKEEFQWALKEAEEKKKQDFSKVEFLTYDEGLCVQCMHIGPYDNEPTTLEKMNDHVREQGYKPDFSKGRFHHEIYISDVRKCKPEKLKTVIRQPVLKSVS